MGRMVTRRLHDLIDQGVVRSAPFLAAAMDAGAIRRQDPELLAHWLLRISLAPVVSPPPGDLRSALDPLLLPLTTPDPDPSSPPPRTRQACTISPPPPITTAPYRDSVGECVSN